MAAATTISEVPDSNAKLFRDTVFAEKNASVSREWIPIKELYPEGADQPLLPEVLSREQFAQGSHFECVMMSALASLVHCPDVIRNCFVSKKVRQDCRYTFQFFRGKEWVKVEIDDRIALDGEEVLFVTSPTRHWWPLLLEKAYAKFYTGYTNLEGCTLQEAFHDLTGLPVLSVPMNSKLAQTAGFNLDDPNFWLMVGDLLAKQDYVAGTITKKIDLESMGLQPEQQYSVLGIYSRTGENTLTDLVIKMYSPFEDDVYAGPLNSQDPTWSEYQLKKFEVNDPRIVIMPLRSFIQTMNSLQFCLMKQVEDDATYFSDEWKGESAGGNPTFISWRKNPLYMVRNNGSSDLSLVAMLKQEDQRRFTAGEEAAKYTQCGLVLVRYAYVNPTPTYFLCGNNHKPIYKSLFLNSRELSSMITIPPKTLCYLVPSTFNKGTNAKFTLALYRIKGLNYSDLAITKLNLPGMEWDRPVKMDLVLQERGKARVDFFVSEETDVHIILTQKKPFASKEGGDAMAQDFAGMYLYDGENKRISGVHAATNFREVSVVHHVPGKGRYALSITCPRSKGEVPVLLNIVGSTASQLKMVATPENAPALQDDDTIDESQGTAELVVVDFNPTKTLPSAVREERESDHPWEDARFFTDNGSVSNNWVRISDLYPDGRKKNLVPDTLKREQFEQGNHFECGLLTAFSTLVDLHPEVIAHCFVSKKPRKDGRYTFQFHRYGEWVKVEIDDRIPMAKKKETLFCWSPTKNWWPLLLEKAYAKFYTMYANVEGVTQEEIYYDFTGRGILVTPLEAELAAAAKVDVKSVDYWMGLQERAKDSTISALTREGASRCSLQDEQYYGVLSFNLTKPLEECTVKDILVKLFNPYEENTYTGPMHAGDAGWTPELKKKFKHDERNVFYMPLSVFLAVFRTLQIGDLKFPPEPRFNFFSEWDKDTAGGMPLLTTWRKNPLYIVRNEFKKPLMIMAMISLPDRRHIRHTIRKKELVYPQVAVSLAQAAPRCVAIPTHLVTMDNHTLKHVGLFLSKRDVASRIIVPARSLNYMVGSCMSREKSKFMLSFWYEKESNSKVMNVTRYVSNMALNAPALTKVVLQNRGRTRIDFLVDEPSDVHVLVRQEKPFQAKRGGDVVTEDHVGVYLYGADDRLVRGAFAAVSYREISLVTRLQEVGRYAMTLSCPKGAEGDIPLGIEIYCSEDAHVRITETPPGAKVLREVDLAFMDQYPEGIPITDLPLDTDPEFLAMVEHLKMLEDDPNSDPKEIEELQRAMNERGHQLAKDMIGDMRPEYLGNINLEALKGVLDMDAVYMEAERKRYILAQDPDAEEELAAMDAFLLARAKALESVYNKAKTLDFLGDSIDGVPKKDLNLDKDPQFAEMLAQLALLMLDPEKNAAAIRELQDKMRARALEIAGAMHEEERHYLDAVIDGIPIEMLPLNEDAEFCRLEAQLRALLASENPDPKAVEALQNKLKNRAAELAQQVKDNLRGEFFDPTMLMNADVLSGDEELDRLEAERIRLMLEDPEGNAERIAELERLIQARAHFLIEKHRREGRGFLSERGLDPVPIEAQLNSDQSFLEKEVKRRALLNDPVVNAAEIKALEDAMYADAQRNFEEYKKDERTGYLKSTYHGRPIETLKLTSDDEFRKLEEQFLKLRQDPNADKDELNRLKEAMSKRADELAMEMNLSDRDSFLPKTLHGIPIDQIGLDEDKNFKELERKRALLLQDEGNEDEIKRIEAEMQRIAEMLADQKRATLRGKYLNDNPEGIPLDLLHLNENKKFGERENALNELYGENDPEKNAQAISAMEEGLNTFATDYARRFKGKMISECVDDEVKKMPLPLASDPEMTDLCVQRGRALEAGDDALAKGIAKKMNERAHAVADKCVADMFARLDPSFGGMEQKDLKLDKDPAFHKMMMQALALMRDPEKNKEELDALFLDMNERAKVIAKSSREAERLDFIAPVIEGRKTDTLPLDADEEFLALEGQRRALLKSQNPDKAALEEVERKLMERATAVAREANAAERNAFMGDNIRGIPISALPLEKDEEFMKMEVERAKMKQRNAPPDQIKALEDAMAKRADEVAAAVLRGDREFMDQNPEAVPLHSLPLEEDPVFSQLEQRRAALKATGGSKKDIQHLEEQMNARAHELAKEANSAIRTKLNQKPQGIPIGELPLNTDREFLELEEAYRAAVKAGDKAGASSALAKLNRRLDEIAKGIHEKERARLNQMPAGIPLSELPLNTDPQFLKLEEERRALSLEPTKNAARLLAIDKELNDRAVQLAHGLRAYIADVKEREIPLDLLKLQENKEYRDVEAELLIAIKDPVKNKDQIAEMRKRMQEIVDDSTARLIEADRQYMNKAPEGIPLNEIPFEDDAEFRAMEVERAILLAEDPKKNEAKIARLEEKLNERLNVLAGGLKKNDYKGLDQAPRGIPLETLRPHSDDKFARLATQLRDLGREPNPDQAQMDKVRAAMNARAHELATERVLADRGFLKKDPLGVKIELLNIDGDKAFADLEARRNNLKARDAGKNAADIKELEEKMNDRLVELAQRRLNNELDGVDQKPMGIPLELLKPYDDPVVAECVKALRTKEHLAADDPEVSDIKTRMNERVLELARAKTEGDRGFLVKDPKGVPLANLPLDEDEKFRDLEVQRAMLKLDNPVLNAAKIKELDDAINVRTHELAEQRLKDDLKGVNKNPRAIALDLIDPHSDGVFAGLVTKRRQLEKSDNPEDQAALKEVVAKMNERVEELAGKLLEGDRAYLETNPGGVPLDILNIDNDKEFTALECQRATLKAQNAQKNASRIRDIEEKLNARTLELAKEKKSNDLNGMPKTVRDIPVESLQPHEDKEFAALVTKLRSIQEDPGTAGDKDALAKVQQAMKDRLEVLANNALSYDYVDSNPEGVPLSDLPLESDTMFHNLEVERAVLKLQDPRRNAAKIEELDEKLNARARDLAKAQKEKDIAGVSDSLRGVPKDILNLSNDDEAARIITDLRAARRDPEANAPAIKELEDKLNQRALDIAVSKLDGDRGYLDTNPEQVPIEDLPIATDEEFNALEVERVKLMSSNVKGCNNAAIKATENMLNERIAQLAQKAKDDDLRDMPKEINGVTIMELDPHEDRVFAEAANLLRLQARDPTASSVDAKKLMEDRLYELAKEKAMGDMYFLAADPKGVPLEELPLNSDNIFLQLKAKREALKEQDPTAHRDAILKLENDMNARCQDLAKIVLDSDLAGLNQKPLDIPIELLHLRNDEVIAKLIPELRRAKRTPHLKNRAADINAQMDERSHKLAKMALEEGRGTYLHPKPGGVPLAELSLDTDKKFHELEAMRAEMRLKDAKGNATAITDLESKLNHRAHELAKTQLSEDLSAMPEAPLGIPLAVLHPHNDAKLATTISEMRVLKRDPLANTEKIRALQAVQRDRVDELARHLLEDDRGYINVRNDYVQLNELPLDSDQEFHRMEVLRAIAKDKNQNTAELEEKLNKRASQLIKLQLEDDVSGLAKAPCGVPLSLLKVHEDGKFFALVPECRRLKKELSRNTTKLKEVRDRMDARCVQMAEDYLEKQRLTYIDAELKGMPITALNLSDNAKFKELEDKKLELQAAGADANKEDIKAIEKELAKVAYESAAEIIRHDRAYLDNKPQGVSMDALPLEQDEEFRNLEAQRAAAKAKRSQNLVEELEQKLNARIQELATQQKKDDISAITSAPCDIPIELLTPHEDATFANMVNELRELKKNPSTNHAQISALETKMDSRVMAIAEAVLKGDRGFLKPNPEGVPLRRLPLDSDEVFHKLEAERAALKLEDPKKNATKIGLLEDKLNDRVTELAKEVKNKDYMGLNSRPRDIPIALVDPHANEKFAALLDERAKLPAAQQRSADEPIVRALNKILEEMAEEHLSGSRNYLEREPEGIHVNLLPLSQDEEFHGMEVERAILMIKDPVANADMIRDLDDSLNKRAAQLAHTLLTQDRNFIEAAPMGVEVAELPLDTDEKYHQLEVERAKLKARDGPANAARVKELESRLNERIGELAKKQLEEDVRGLDRDPNGYALSFLNPHKDQKFQQLVAEIRDAKKNDPSKVADLQKKMNDRTNEMAKARIAEDRKFMDKAPQGVPLELLNIENDALFRAAEKELRTWKANPKPSEASIAEAQARMAQRTDELAREILRENRGFLDAEPEGVALEDVPLDSDATYKAKEVERLRMLADPKRMNPKDLALIEEQLNDRAHELARQTKKKNREFLKPKSFGIPKDLIALDSNKDFVKMEKELQHLLKNPALASPAQIEKIRSEMQLLSDDIAENQVKGNRDRYLIDALALGVDIIDLNLEKDEIYMNDEIDRAARVAADPVENKDVIRSLEARLNGRALDLAKNLIAEQRKFLPDSFLGIPLEELPIDTDDRFKRMERQLRIHHRGNQREEVLRDQEDLKRRAEQLAEDIVRQDLSALKPSYRGISKEDLNLHGDEKFRLLAAQARKKRAQGRVVAPEFVGIEDLIEQRVAEIADNMIGEQRAFLPQEPEGMPLVDVPLDSDMAYMQLEAERRRRLKDPRSKQQHKDVLRELEGEMAQRANALARIEFAKRRGFMEQEPEGIPLIELGLDEDQEFKDAEITRYKDARDAHPNDRVQDETARRMGDRAYQLARAMLAADRGFLHSEPEGVPLAELPLDTDHEFNELARERRRRKRGMKGGFGEDEVKFVEDRMNNRCVELARDFLRTQRAFLDREPEGVPLEELPLNADVQFRKMENARLAMKREPGCSETKIATAEADLNNRAHEIARELLKKERAFLDPQPMGVSIEDLPLNFDEILNPIERRRRILRKDHKRNQDEIRSCEDQMADRVNDIAITFIENERNCLDQNPEGVPLRYLPLDSDKEFHELELNRRQLNKRPESNRELIASMEKKMNERCKELAREMIEKGRSFLDAEPYGVPIADIALNEDETFRRMEEHRRVLKEDSRNLTAVRDIENRLNDRAYLMAEELLTQERAFMNPAPLGISLVDLPLNSDRRMREIERTRRRLRKDPAKYESEIRELEDGMEQRAYEMARKVFADNRGYLEPEPCGVPLDDIPLDNDKEFHNLELERHNLVKRNKNPDKVADLERQLNARACQLAEDFIQKERAYLHQEPEGIPIGRLPLDRDYAFHSMELERRQMVRNGEKQSWIEDLENRLNQRLHEIAREVRGWRDEEFHEPNQHVGQEWVRICELYPEGRGMPLDPEFTSGMDVDSAPGDAGYLAPFIAALGRHPVLLKRLIATRDHPVIGPYSFIFFDPNSNPVYVDVDDRVPCDADLQPCFTRSPTRMWYPLLIEKAYAKFVGGYDRLDDCTPHETLRDLTGRPVTHIPFDSKLAAAANIGDYTSVSFWRGVGDDLARGDVIMCLSKGKDGLDGIHPQCSYALLGVVDTIEGSLNPSDIVLKLHNTYRSGGTYYDGPLSHNDPNWTEHLRRVCKYESDRDDVIYMPLPTFLRCFSSMQSCHINCGDRLTAAGTWERVSAGGNPKFTTFRNNPIYLVENKSSRAAVILAEVRHNAPTFVDGEGLSHYPQTGIVLMQPLQPSMPPTPLITNSTHQFLQKGMMLDSREVCSVMELPPSSTCYLIPYTMKPGETGSFNLSVYPGMAKVTLTPLHNGGLSREPVMTRLTLVPGDEGRRVDFMLSAAADVHVLLHQDKISDERNVRKGDTIAEDDVVMSVFNEQGSRLANSGDATNAREHSLVFKAEKPGRYALLLTSPNQRVTGDCPCTLSLYTSKRTTVKFVPPPAGARPLQQMRFPQLPKTAPDGSRRGQSQRAAPRGDDSRSLPPLRQPRSSSAASSRYSRGY